MQRVLEGDHRLDLGVAAVEVRNEAMLGHIDRNRPPAADLDLGGDAPGNDREVEWAVPLLKRSGIRPGMPHALDRVRILALD